MTTNQLIAMCFPLLTLAVLGLTALIVLKWIAPQRTGQLAEDSKYVLHHGAGPDGENALTLGAGRMALDERFASISTGSVRHIRAARLELDQAERELIQAQSR
jgi:hypothetical protein